MTTFCWCCQLSWNMDRGTELEPGFPWLDTENTGYAVEQDSQDPFSSLGQDSLDPSSSFILPSGGNHVVFLELRQHSRVTTGISAFPLLNWNSITAESQREALHP